MKFEQVKKLLKDGYERAGFDVVDELPSGDMLLRYPTRGARDVTLMLTSDDVSEYTELLQSQRSFQTEPAPCSLVTRSYREHVVLPLADNISDKTLRDFNFALADSDTYVEIDYASLVFANYFRFDVGYMGLCLDRLYMMPERLRKRSQEKPFDIRQIFARPLTIRAFNLDASSIQEAIDISTRYIDSSLFTLAKQYKVPLMLAYEFPAPDVERVHHFEANDHRLNQIIDIDADLRSDLVTLYQAGLASPIPTHQFLSYFQILEFFFQDVRHAGTYQAVETVLKQPDFELTESTTQQLIDAVNTSQTEQNTMDLLAQLIRNHVAANELRDFIQAQGMGAAETINTLARKLVTLRNAIVDAGGRLLPISPTDPTIRQHVPLVRFLAEQVMHADD